MVELGMVLIAMYTITALVLLKIIGYWTYIGIVVMATGLLAYQYKRKGLW